MTVPNIAAVLGLMPGSAGALATTGLPVNVAEAAPGLAGDLLTLTDPEHAEWSAPPATATTALTANALSAGATLPTYTRPADLGASLIVNGAFSFSDAPWTFGPGWARSGNKAVKSAGSAGALAQELTGLIPGRTYLLRANVTRSAGGVYASLGGAEAVNIWTINDFPSTYFTEEVEAQALLVCGDADAILSISGDSTLACTLGSVYLYLLPEHTTLPYFPITDGKVQLSVSSPGNNFIWGNAVAKTLTGSGNLVIGEGTGKVLGEGSNNVCLGYAAMSRSRGSNNVAIGPNSLRGFGYNTGNVAVGPGAASSLCGSGNVAVGVSAGSAHGGNVYTSTFLGANAGGNSVMAGLSKVLCLGAYSRTTLPSTAVIGGIYGGDYALTLGLGTEAPATSFGKGFHIKNGPVRQETPHTPASATDTGLVGEMCWNADYVYVCVAENTWKRAALATW